MSTQIPADLLRKLAAPFRVEEVQWKPAVVSGNRALALAYVNARVIQDRLDDVLGVENWQDDYQFLPEGNVVCRLSLRINGEWITKVDVGGPSEQPDGGDRLKASVSDSLKRAAVKFGCGRFLYRLPQQWVDYDSQHRQFVKTPTLPDFARPVVAMANPSTTGKPETPETADIPTPTTSVASSAVASSITDQDRQKLGSDLEYLGRSLDMAARYLYEKGIGLRQPLKDLRQLSDRQFRTLREATSKMLKQAQRAEMAGV